MKVLDRCLCCSGTQLEQYLDLGDIAIRRCEACGHSQQAAVEETPGRLWISLDHKRDPQAFLTNNLQDLVLVEFLYGGWVLGQGYWKAISDSPQRVSYFLISSLLALVRSSGWTIRHLQTCPSTEGFVLASLERSMGDDRLPGIVGEYLEREIMGKLLCPSFYQEFALRVQRDREGETCALKT